MAVDTPFRNGSDRGGEATRTGRLEIESRDGLHVADDGPEIPDAARERVFEYGDGSDPDASALGLATVAPIVDDHRWDFSVIDGVEGGARFEVTTVARQQQNTGSGDVVSAGE